MPLLWAVAQRLFANEALGVIGGAMSAGAIIAAAARELVQLPLIFVAVYAGRSADPLGLPTDV